MLDVYNTAKLQNSQMSNYCLYKKQKQNICQSEMKGLETKICPSICLLKNLVKNSRNKRFSS